MKILYYSILAFLTLSCATGITLNPERLQEPSTAVAPLDTLAAYRKYPGQPKTQLVHGYWRHTMHGTDSVFVQSYYRSAAN